MSRKHVYPALTGLRALAAYLVYGHHYPDSVAAPHTWFRLWVEQGYVGVSLFFVLSGFLIHRTYADRMAFNRAWLGRYMRNRFARIYPLYALAVVAIHISDCNFNLRSWLINLTLIKGLHNATKFHGVAQAWSLTVEECFYVCFVAYIALSRRFRHGLALGLVGTYALGLVIAALSVHGPRSSFAINLTFIAGYTFLGRATDFFVGMAVAVCIRRPNAWLHRLPYPTALGLSAITASMAALASLGHTHPTLSPVSLPLGLVLLHGTLAPAAGLLIFGLATEAGLLQHCLASRPALALGRSSYAFYLIHIGPLATGLMRLGFTPLRHPALLFALLVALSWGLYTWVEKPLHLRLSAV